MTHSFASPRDLILHLASEQAGRKKGTWQDHYELKSDQTPGLTEWDVGLRSIRMAERNIPQFDHLLQAEPTSVATVSPPAASAAPIVTAARLSSASTRKAARTYLYGFSSDAKESEYECEVRPSKSLLLSHIICRLSFFWQRPWDWAHMNGISVESYSQTKDSTVQMRRGTSQFGCFIDSTKFSVCVELKAR